MTLKTKVKKGGIAFALLLFTSSQALAFPSFKSLGKIIDTVRSTGIDKVVIGKGKLSDVSYKGINIGSVLNGTSTQEDEIGLFTGGVDLILKETTGANSSPYTKILGGFLGALNKKSAQKASHALGGDRPSDGSAGSRSTTEESLFESEREIVGALGALIPEAVKSEAQSNAGKYLGSGGGLFGVNKAVQTEYMGELTENEVLSQSIDSLFSEDGQKITAQLQSAVEENSQKATQVAAEASQMKASLDVSKAIASQFSVLAMNQTATYGEAIQNRMTTAQGNQLTAKLLKMQMENKWHEQIERVASRASDFNAAAGFASLVDSKEAEPSDTGCSTLPSLPSLPAGFVASPGCP